MKFTENQLQVLRLLAEGLTQEEIAKERQCTTENIRNYIDRLKIKLKANNNVNVVYKAVKKGVIQLNQGNKKDEPASKFI